MRSFVSGAQQEVTCARVFHRRGPEVVRRRTERGLMVRREHARAVELLSYIKSRTVRWRRY